MTSLDVPKPLEIHSTVISYPYSNPNQIAESVNNILVDIFEEKTNKQTVSLRYAFGEYHPKYAAYIRKNKTNKHHIIQYIDKHVETAIDYKYDIGQFGYITHADSLEKSFGFIQNKSEYVTEFYFVHDILQKYQFQHCDITSALFKQFADSEFDGESNGWIIESIFTPVLGTMDAKNDTEHLLNWKICREDYLLKKMSIMELELNKQIADRGYLFRETVNQWLYPAVKALRGKITQRNVGRIVEVPFNTPQNCWDYFLGPTISEIFGLSQDEQLHMEGNCIDIELDMIELCGVIDILYCYKFYDQYANAFKLNQQIKFDIQETDIKLVQDRLVQNLNEYAMKRYKKLKEDSSNKLLTLKKVKYMLTIDGLEWKYNKTSNKSYFIANVYKILFLRSGQTLTTGKVN